MTPYFPFEFAAEFVTMCANHPDVRLINYADLVWGGPEDHFAEYYPSEYKRSRMMRPADKIDVLIQYDVDRHADRTARLLCVHEEQEARATVMVFATPPPGEGYHPELHRFRSMFRREKFALGYHTRAYEDAGFDPALIEGIFMADLSYLQAMYGMPVQFFSPHGGNRDPQDRTNVHALADMVEQGTDLFNTIRWVHNKWGPRFDGVYSDGGLGSPRYNAERDLRKFTRTWKKGNRYRVLLHPQYYADGHQPGRMADQEWYREIIEVYKQGESVWNLSALSS